MQSFVVFQISIKEWIFIIPLNFESYYSRRKTRDVVYFVRDGFAFDAIYRSPNFKFVLTPAVIMECAP